MQAAGAACRLRRTSGIRQSTPQANVLALPGFCPLTDDRVNPEYRVSVWYAPTKEGCISFLVRAHESVHIFTIQVTFRDTNLALVFLSYLPTRSKPCSSTSNTAGVRPSYRTWPTCGNSTGLRSTDCLCWKTRAWTM